MKKKRILFTPIILLILVFSIEVIKFVNDVNDQLRISSIKAITESTHQGANALNIQFEIDFDTLQLLWEKMEYSDTPENIPTLYKGVEPNIRLYHDEIKNSNISSEFDQNVNLFLKQNEKEKGILDSHICTITGDNVFNIFVKGTLADGSTAYIVKEYVANDIAKQFTLSFYDNTGFSYIINRDGNIMVRSEHQNSNKTVYNIFDMISNDRNNQYMIDKFKENVNESKSGWTNFIYDGKGWIFCYEPLEVDSNWILVSIVPESVIQEQTASILRKTMIFSGIALATVLVIVILFYRIKLHENEEHTKELTKALNEADIANRAKNRFLADISHDIRTPLNAIVGMTTIAQENINDKYKIENCLAKIKVSSVHLLSLISDILDMSQIEKGKLILKEEVINIVEVFEETVDLMVSKMQEEDLTLEIPPIQIENETVIADPLRVRQILLNIIRNAVKYTPAGGHIILELTQTEQNNYVFRCKDTGIGMEPEFVERIFLPFERARNTTDSKISGIGVGLAITKKLLDLMGGEIFVESEPQKGSTFTVKFYFDCQPQEQENIDLESENIDYSDKHVLLVEDNELNMEIMEELLGMTNIQIEEAFNGQEAVSMVSQKPQYYDLIFMDIQMPIMDGYEATRQIRNIADAKEVPIFAVSANALANDVKAAIDAGMNGHIAKPVDLSILEEVLKKCFQK